MKRSDIPNIITVFRFLLVPPVVLLLLNHRYGAALIVFGVAGFSDALDGFLAKRYGWSSRMGAIMDPLADKLLLVASFVTLGWLGLIPPWLVALVILRDVVIVIGAMIYHWCVVSRNHAPDPAKQAEYLYPDPAGTGRDVQPVGTGPAIPVD